MTYKNINYCFSTNLSFFNDKLDQKKSYDLISKWSEIPKTKQKRYYKLYYQLLKNKIVSIEKNKKRKKKWIIKNLDNRKILNNPSLYEIGHYNCFIGKHFFGYTRHGEKIYNRQTIITHKNLYTSYNKLKKYIL